VPGARHIHKPIRVDKPGLHVADDVDAVIATNTGGTRRATASRSAQTVHTTQRRQTRMTERLPQPADQEPRDELSQDELEQQEGEPLPDREAMSLINANIAAPVNAAVALNALSDGSVAVADAEQDGTITQTN